MDCDCSCMGAFHGENAGNWFERAGDAVVADRGETTRAAVVYGALGGDGDLELYSGELRGRRYCVDRTGRSEWPKASRFMCAACVSARASVWDHCHTHGYVRAPLCNPCNTRHWSGWRPEAGRVEPSHNIDSSYFRWCLDFEITWKGSCSA